MLPTEISGGVCFTSRYVGNSATRDQAVTGQACDFSHPFPQLSRFFSASAALGSVQSWYYLKVTWCKKGGERKKEKSSRP